MTAGFNLKAQDLSSITQPKNNKLAPIILISRTDVSYDCSAFVINDTTAITATHCVTYASNATSVPMMAKSVTFYVYDSNGNPLNMIATRDKIFNYNEYDIATLTGDFRSFNKIKMPHNAFNLKEKDKLFACGFPGGMTPVACTSGEYISKDYFKGVMTNYIARGMSGGPVLDKNLNAVGVISASYKKYSFFGILFGLVKGQ